MRGAFYCRAELTAPWGLTLPPLQDHLWFHVVLSGRLQLEIGGQERDWVELGDLTLAVVPHGHTHVIRSEPGTAAPGIVDLERAAVGDRYDILRYGGGGVATELICGAVRFEHPAAALLVASLPQTICLGGPDVWGLDSIGTLLRLMVVEAAHLRPGGEAVITRLADLVVVDAIRAWIKRDPAARRGWLGALQDRQIGRALSLVHRDPGADWTVASLAQEIGMSRAAFAARFSTLVGEPPMSYVTRWRMRLAVAALEREDATTSQIANRFGYKSEAGFSRAFLRVIGVSPTTVRKAASEERDPMAEARATRRRR